MITRDMFKDVVPEEHCLSFAYTVNALARIGLLTAENDASGIISEVQKEADLATLVQMINAMMTVVIDGAEDLAARAKKTAAPKEVSDETA